MSTTLIFLAVVVPAFVAGIIFLALRTNRAAGALALGAAFLAGHVGMAGWPAFPPANATQKLFFIVAGSIVLGALHSVERPAATKWLRALLSFVLPWYLILRSNLTPLPFSMALVGMVCVQILWASFDGLLARLGGVAGAGAFWLGAAGAAVTLALAVSVQNGLLCASLAAGLGANIVLAWFKPAWRLQRSAVPVVTAVFAGELICVCAFDDFPVSSAILLALAPNLAWLATLKPIQKLSRWQQVLICGGAMLVPIAIAIWLQPPLEM